jgi:hypothetical protein
MWIVEIGTAYLGTQHFTVQSTRKFRTKRKAREFFVRYVATLKGGTGYWDYMPVPSARMREKTL